MTAREYKKKGRVVQINIKYSSFQSITRQSMFQLPEISHGENGIDKVEKIENAIYIIRQKYGSSIINRAI